MRRIKVIMEFDMEDGEKSLDNEDIKDALDVSMNYWLDNLEIGTDNLGITVSSK